MIEIDKDYFCVGNGLIDGKCEFYDLVNGNYCDNDGSCDYKYRKWPTPIQFEQEYGFAYPDDGAVYTLGIIENNTPIGWEITKWGDVKHQYGKINIIEKSPTIYMIVEVVCACTPFGPPYAEWRPE